jgi:hypothetical protein
LYEKELHFLCLDLREHGQIRRMMGLAKFGMACRHGTECDCSLLYPVLLCIDLQIAFLLSYFCSIANLAIVLLRLFLKNISSSQEHLRTERNAIFILKIQNFLNENESSTHAVEYDTRDS